MKLDFSSKLLDIKGQPIKEGDLDVTLGLACSTALLNVFPDEKDLGGGDKAKRFGIAVKVANGGEQDLTVDELAEIKKLVGKMFAPLIVGRVYEIIDGTKP